MASSTKRTAAGDDRSGNKRRRYPVDLEFADDHLQVEESESSDDVEINLITDTGRIIPVTVKGSDTIDKIKLKIQSKEHIPVVLQELFFKQKAFRNTNISSNLPIKEFSFILMGESSGFINIFINNLEGKLISSLQVKPSDTIADVKIKMRNFRKVLIFNGVVLEDSGTLADFNIINGSTLTGVDISKAKMEIFVNNIFTGKTISLLVSPADTIANVKLNIMYEDRVPVDEQALIFNGMALVDSGTLLDFNINMKSTLTLVRKSRGLMQIFIKTFIGESVTVDVNLSHTIGSVKTKIQDKIRIPHDEQELIFNGMVLDSLDTFADLHINEDSNLTLVRISMGCIDIVIKMQSGNIINMKVKPSNAEGIQDRRYARYSPLPTDPVI